MDQDSGTMSAAPSAVVTHTSGRLATRAAVRVTAEGAKTRLPSESNTCGAGGVRLTSYI